MNTSGKKGTLIQSVERTLDILELLCHRDTAIGVSEIARNTGLKIPTAHNLLRTLYSRGYVTQEDGGQRYRLGYPCARLGWAYQQHLRLVDIYKPAVIELAKHLMSSVYIAVVENSTFFFAATVTAGSDLNPHFTEMWSEISYQSACVRVFLSYMSEDDIRAYIKAHPFKLEGCVDLQSRKELDKIIRQCREQGYIGYERNNHTEFAVGVPIYDYSKRVVAAISMAIPMGKLNEVGKPTVISEITGAARTISVALGCP